VCLHEVDKPVESYSHLDFPASDLELFKSCEYGIGLPT
jgi:hypothetical protein